MPSRSKITPAILVTLGLAGALLIVRASISAPTRVPTSTPTAAPTRTPSPTWPPTSTPTPTPTLTPTPAPVQLSPPFVGPGGGMAYVEDGRLVVVAADGQVTVVAERGAAHGLVGETPAAGPPGSGPVAWSPDGRRILYVTEHDASREYHVWDAGTGQTLHLDQESPDFPSDAARPAEHAWSPDGTHLLFHTRTRHSPADSGAWVLDLETQRLWRVAAGSQVVTATWVNTRTILYQEHDGADAERLRIVALDAPREPLTDTLADTGPSRFYALSPDRRYLAEVRVHGEPNRRLRVAPLPGHPPLTLPTQPTVTTPLESAPLWSPDGRWVAYGALALAPSGEGGAYTVLVDTTGISATQVITGLVPQSWAPDGRLLAGPSCHSLACGPAVADPLSGQVVTVAPGEQVRLWDLAWSPQGIYLAYSLNGTVADLGGLALWDRATGERRLLMPGGEQDLFTNLQWAPDGCTLYAAQRENRAGSATGADAPVRAIWGAGPDWEHRWRVAPGPATGNGPQPCPPSPLAGRRLIAYYGTPAGPGLGILGRYDVTTTLELLAAQTQPYRDLDPDVETVSALHMVTTIADGYPGADGTYSHRVSDERLRQWVDSARAAGAWSVLDVQPGQGDLDTELDLIEPFLWEPDVHLAVDPEFMMGEDEVPGNRLGQITGPQINRVQARLDRIGRATGGRKILVVHQFDGRMIEQKEAILHYPFVDLVWDADGFGGLWAKTGDYNQYRHEPGFEYGGFKLFYNYDVPLMTPEQVLALEPPPAVVIYQ